MTLLNKLIKDLTSKVYKNKAKKNLSNYVSAIKKTNYFDSAYYLSNCLGKPKNQDLSQNPILHFLKEGAKNGCNPNNWFDCEWYIKKYPDVKESGMNPFLHYILHGEDEGRETQPKESTTNNPQHPDYHDARLWCGFSRNSIELLKDIAEKNNKEHSHRALWFLARWEYARGEWTNAKKYLNMIHELKRKPSKRYLVATSKINAMLNIKDENKEILQKEEWSRITGSSRPYILANASNCESEVLSEINSIYSENALIKITKKNKEAPLSIGNLTAHLPPRQPSTSEKPLVSVIIPTFNAAKTLHIALDSLLNQTWPNIEILVVDDCSEDNTKDIVKKYTKTHKNIKLLSNEKNKGAYPSRNFGAKHSKGSLITIHDSDDWSHPQKIQLQAEALLSEKNIICTLSRWVRVTDNLKFIGSWFLNESFVEKNHSSSMIKRSVLEEIGYWDPVNVGGDTEFLWRLEHKYGSYAIKEILTDIPLSFSLVSSTSLTRTSSTHVKTIHYGLRRLYREAANWWHRTHPHEKLSQEKRSFPSPIGNSRESKLSYDILVCDDFSNENKRLQSTLNYIEENYIKNGLSVSMFHWPDYYKDPKSKIDDTTFNFIQRHNLQLCHPGVTLDIKTTILFTPELIKNPPDELPTLKDKNAWKTLIAPPHSPVP